jgi:hypothetical protein
VAVGRATIAARGGTPGPGEVDGTAAVAASITRARGDSVLRVPIDSAAIQTIAAASSAPTATAYGRQSRAGRGKFALM